MVSFTGPDSLVLPGFPGFPGAGTVSACVVLSGRFPFPEARASPLSAAASAASFAFASSDLNPSDKIVSLVGIKNAKLRRMVRPGDALEIEAKITQKRSNMWRFQVKASTEEQTMAEALLAISIVDRDDTL